MKNIHDVRSFYLQCRPAVGVCTMLEMLNRYSHGLAAIPILHALRERGCLARLAETASISAEQLASEFSANRAYLDVALRMLVCLDWIRPAGDGRYKAMPGLASANIIPDRIMDLYRFPFDLYVQGSAGEPLEPWLEMSEQRWNSDHPYLPDYLDGLIIVPLLLSVRAQRQISIVEEKDSATVAATLRLNVDRTVRRVIERLFVARGWADQSAEALNRRSITRRTVRSTFRRSVAATVAESFSSTILICLCARTDRSSGTMIKPSR